MKTRAPYGTWTSNLTGSFIAQQSLRLGSPLALEHRILWLEARPAEQGRQVIVIKDENGQIRDLLPQPWSARSKVHEYGGGAYTAQDNTLYFVNGLNQQIYRMDIDQGNPEALTYAPNCRFADLAINADHTQLIAVCEQHSPDQHEPENFLICIDLKETHQALTESALCRIAMGHDFYSNPRISPCGLYLAYITWDHPNMPWDNTQLWLQEIGKSTAARLIAGNGNESVAQPNWSPNGDLFWVSDKSNWWNIYYLQVGDASNPEKAECVYALAAEFATPQWVFGMSSYCIIDATTLLASYSQNGQWHLVELKNSEGHWQSKAISTPLNSFSELTCGNNKALFSAASPVLAADLYVYENGDLKQLRSNKSPAPISEDISVGQIIQFPTGNNEFTAYAVFYLPKNSRFAAPLDSKPPLIVFGHGGPTGCADAAFSYKVQFWTQRGFAVLDVNYRGSTGFGRQYRHSLQKQWGVYDVEDLAAATEFVTEQGWVHPQQRVVRGGSAGGFTVLAALTDTNTFNAGCSLYGVGDLETLATDTHKFEARYLDSLIGPYPEKKSLYIERSPIHKINNVSCPILVFQGAEDKVVPPNQAETIVAAAKKRGLPVAYVLYENEGHGFRRAENIEHQAEAELYFYQRVLQLKTFSESDVAPIEIMNAN